MKLLFTRIFIHCLFLWLLMLSGCSNESVPSHWDGTWERRVNVPQGMPGSCYDEKLLIAGRIWELTAIIHSTFECNQPFLELGFTADIEEVLIKKSSQNNNVILKISDIRMTSMIDVATNEAIKLSDKSVAIQSAKYVPEKWQQLKQKLLFNADKNRMSAALFMPTAAVAIPQYIEINPQITFQRLTKQQSSAE